MRGLRSFGQLVWRLLRELSDETAYQRHLSLHSVRSSPEEWRRASCFPTEDFPVAMKPAR